jgi:hypothetical protein
MCLLETERRLRADAEQLKLALAEATVQLRIWRKATRRRPQPWNARCADVACCYHAATEPTAGSWARVRRQVFHDLPTVHSRGLADRLLRVGNHRRRIWRICAVIDYATEHCLAVMVTPTSRGADAHWPAST